MEEFFDYLLGLLLIVLIGITGMIIYFSIHAPAIASALAAILLTAVSGTIGALVRKSLRKRHLKDWGSVQKLPEG